MSTKINSTFLNFPLNRHFSSDFISLKYKKDYDLFNPTQLFECNKKWFLAVRAQSTKKNKSVVLLYEKINSNFILRKDFKKYPLEDPFITKIKDDFIFGGVEIRKYKTEIKYRTVFYIGKSIFSLKLFFKAPYKMKDIRLVDLNGKIGLFTRPQGEVYGRGQIGFILLKSIEDIKTIDLYSAKIILNFDSNLWGGVNQALLYKKKLCVIAHFAYVTFENNLEIKHYVPVSFTYNYSLDKCENIKLLGFRNYFKNFKSSNKELNDIIFPGGINIKGKDANLYVGVSDTSVGCLSIENPFNF